MLHLDHIQIAIPNDGAQAATLFYSGVMGLSQIARPDGGSAPWFMAHNLAVHTGFLDPFVPTTKGHVAFRPPVGQLPDLADRIGAAGYSVQWDDRQPGIRRFFTNDPFGNRLELTAGASPNIASFIQRGTYLTKHGPAHAAGLSKSNRKLCFAATDQAALASLLLELADRPDCYFVKLSAFPRDGMFLGRCFLTDDDAVGRLAYSLKQHPKFITTVQDDDYFKPFRQPS